MSQGNFNVTASDPYELDDPHERWIALSLLLAAILCAMLVTMAKIGLKMVFAPTPHKHSVMAVLAPQEQELPTIRLQKPNALTAELHDRVIENCLVDKAHMWWFAHRNDGQQVQFESSVDFHLQRSFPVAFVRKSS